MSPRLDPLLERLRRERISPLALKDVECLVWERIEAHERRARSLRSQVPLQLAAVVAAFAIGILFGGVASTSPGRMQTAFVEELESVPSGTAALLF